MGAAVTDFARPCTTVTVTEFARPCANALGHGQQDELEKFPCDGRVQHACYGLEELETVKFCARSGKLVSCLGPEEASHDREFSKYGWNYSKETAERIDSRATVQALCPAGGFVLLHPHGLSDVYGLKPRPLGWGTFGDVHIAVHNETGALRAVKTINKTWLRRTYSYMQEGEVNNFVRREVEVLRTLDHPHIVRLYEAFDNAIDFQVVLELCQGGTLTSRIEPQQERLPEPEALGFFKQMLAAVQHLHSHGFVHRDLKPDNFMFARPSLEDEPFSHEESCLKLIDFGLARRLGVDTGLHNSRGLGTKNFKPPELDIGQCVLELADRIDMWALGVILFIIFGAELPPANVSEILNDQAALGATLIGRISAFGVDLLSHLLMKEPLWRPTALMAMQHAWCNGGVAKRQPILCSPEGFVRLVDEYARSPQLRRLALLAVAHVADDHDIEYASVRRHFQALEFESEGNITRDAIKTLSGAGGSLGSMARKMRKHFDELDIDGTHMITWTEFLAIFIKVHGHVTTDACACATDVPKIIVSEEICRRAFYLLSDGTDKISAVTIGELFAPVKSGRVLDYEMRRSPANKYQGFSQSMGRDQMVREANLKGSLEFDCFMRMLGNSWEGPEISEVAMPTKPLAAELESNGFGGFSEITGLWNSEDLPEHRKAHLDLDAEDLFFEKAIKEAVQR